MTLRPLGEDDLPTVVDQAATSFGRAVDDELRASYSARVAAGEVWGLDRDGAVLGHCRLLPSEHWLGGRRVPCLDIASVAVPPEHRGQSVASTLMRDVVAHGVRDGYGLSLLYPSTTRLYRQLGWEQSGSLTRYRVPARALPRSPAAVRRGAGAADWAAIRACHERYAASLPGAAVRSSRRWEELATVPYRYVVDAEGDTGEGPGPAGAIEAYALVEHRPIRDSWQHVLRLADWSAITPRGLAAVVGFAASHGTFARDVELVDSRPPRWATLVAEQELAAAGGLYWMARGLDVPTAIAHRGFPAGLDLSVAIAIDDDTVPSGPWRLAVAGGRGELIDAEAADVHLSARAVGPLLTGFRSASELALIGSLSGPPEAIEGLDAAFAGPPPVMLDFF